MPTFIYLGSGNALVIAGQSIPRGIPTELSGRAAEEAAGQPKVHVFDEDEAAAAAGYPGMTVKELHAMAEQRGIEMPSRAKKDVLIAALEANDQAEPEEPAAEPEAAAAAEEEPEPAEAESGAQ